MTTATSPENQYFFSFVIISVYSHYINERYARNQYKKRERKKNNRANTFP